MPAHADRLPRQRRGTTPQMHGRYPDYDVLSQAGHWDEVTRRMVLGRVDDVPEICFFTAREAATLGALTDVLTAQDSEPRIPVVNFIDDKYARGQSDGYQYDDMPDDDFAWQLVARGLDEEAARRANAASFAAADDDTRRAIVDDFANTRLSGGAWADLNVKRAFALVMRVTLSCFYSHPWAWNEIGFGGPAYPRGYSRFGSPQLQPAEREPWEGREAVDTDPVSDTDEPAPRMNLRGSLIKGVTKMPKDNDSAWLLDTHKRGLQNLDRMARHSRSETVDLVVIGAGAGGVTLAQRLARAGWKIVILERGPFWDPDRDWVSDEKGAGPIYWTDKRIISGSDPVEMGKNNSGVGVGGSMTHFAGYVPRLHPSDFEVRTRDGVAVDWPISYSDLKESFERVERELPVAGQDWPWGDPHTYPHAPHPVSSAATVAWRGAEASGIEMRVGPVSITNGRFGNRPHCIYRGFCLQGCKVNAKASPLVTHLPDAIEHGVEVRSDSMAVRIEVDEQSGRAVGVTYVSDGEERFQPADAVAVCGYAIETPRLLLNSSSRRFPDGLGNEHDQVGRYVMVQGASQVAGRFGMDLRMYKAPPPEVSSEQFYETDERRGFARGFSIQTLSPLPIGWAEHVQAEGHWGQALREYMRDYNHWSILGLLNELLPHPENRVTLTDQTDQFGMPIPNFSYSLSDNDKANIAYGTKVLQEIWNNAGAEEQLKIDRYAHLVGGARMGLRPEESVVDSSHRVWGVPNLFIVDGSVLPTQGAANPALVIMALADRCAGLLKDKRTASATAGHASP